MQFLRRAVLIVVVPLLALFLYVTAIDSGFVRVGARPDSIKQILADSGVYGSVVKGLLEQAGKVTSSGGDVSLNEPIVRAAAEKTFSPSFIQSNAEAAIDSTYRWLDGKTPLPDFQIDLTAAKAQFAANIAEAVQKRLVSLPACATAASSIENFDVFKATCLPKGTNPAAEAATIQNNILKGGNFLDHPVITADSIKPAGSSRSVFAENLRNVPEAYQKAKNTPWAFGLISLLLMASIVLLSDSKRKGLKRVGITMLMVGIVLLVFSWGLNRVVAERVAPNIKLNNPVLADKLRVLLIKATQEIDKTYWAFGAGYTALGALAVAATTIKRRGSPGAGPETHIKPSLKEPPSAPGASSGPKMPPKKRPIKIQG